MIASHTHVFLFDAHLGTTWQVTNEGSVGAEYNQLIEDFCCAGASSSKKRGACSESNELKGLCCWQKPCFSPALYAEISGDGNSIVIGSDFDYTGSKEIIDGDVDLFHYYIPTSTFTRITKTNNKDYDEIAPSTSYNGDKILFGQSKAFDISNVTNSLVGKEVFLAELSMGCSGSTDATNYVQTPDVETCCTWSTDIGPHEAGAATSKVTLTFSHLDPSKIIERIPFKTAAEVTDFCSRVAEQVKSDVACALDIPPSLITVDTSSAACGWASDFTQAVTVELTLHQLCTGTVTGLASPSDLAAAIVSQHADSSSRLWRGYLTKTLDKDVAPVTAEVTSTATTCTAATPTPTPAATPAPTAAAATPAPTTAADVEATAPQTVLLALAAIRLLC
jgi:hypothetical protein